MLRPPAAEPAHELPELGSFLEQRLETIRSSVTVRSVSPPIAAERRTFSNS